MDPSKMLRARNDGKVEWNIARCILPVAYYPWHTAEYATVILASDWLYFSRHGIKYSTIQYDVPVIQYNTYDAIQCNVIQYDMFYLYNN